QFNSFIQPACLPSSSTPYDPKLPCEMAGWGRWQRDSKAKPDKLQSVRLPIMSSEECHHSFPSLNRYFLTNDSFCAGYNDREVGGCHGDSGGPFVCNINGWSVFASIIMHNYYNITRVQSPNILLRVASFVDWIEGVINNHE
ncbi:hypothetical protein HELRODRAFT_73425, partial [Helobdella robusta]|uniref:Peptidase S1 domain-containing protein n=1 Tax=Helobdella robusta TaxID=6412 RepID=T1G1D8_HELRO